MKENLTEQHDLFDDYFEQCALLLNLRRNHKENDNDFKERIKQKYLDPLEYKKNETNS